MFAGYLLDRSASRHLCREYGSPAAPCEKREKYASLNQDLFIVEGRLADPKQIECSLYRIDCRDTWRVTVSTRSITRVYHSDLSTGRKCFLTLGYRLPECRISY
jgi:hypothetical protein